MAAPQNYNNPTALAAQNYNPTPMPAAQNYNPTPMPAAQNYNPAPMRVAQNYNPTPMPAAQNYNPAPMPVAQNYNPAPMPVAQNYNPTPMPTAQNYNPARVPAAQSYNAPQAPGAQSYNAPQAPGAQYYNKPTAGGRRGGDYYNRPLPKDGRRFSSTASDDSMLTNQILASDKSHARPYDVTLLSLKHILQTVDVILSRVAQPDIHSTVTGALVPGAHADALEHEKASHAIISSLPDNYDVPTSLFNAISCEIFCKWLSGEDANKTTMDILDTVQHYDWDEKVVLALGAFAVKDGEYWLVAHLYTTNPLAKAVGQLKQVQEILEHAGTRLKPKFDAYNNLVRAVLNVTKCIVQLHDLHRNPVMTTEAESAATTALIPTAVYWTIRSIVVAATQLLGITGMGPEHMTEAWELSSLAHKLENIHSHLKENLDRLLDIIKRKKEEQELSEISYILESPHIDNDKPLRVLFYKDDQPALYDCYNKKRVDIDVLKRKVVILFLSDIDVVHENEYMIVQQMYLEKGQNPTRTESQYEVVWVPIVDMWTDAKYQQFEDLRRNMDWYTLFHPSVVPKTAIRYIRKQDKWNYGKTPLLVVMDPQGKIVHTNAVHMMCVWGSIAFPFTSNREKLLWEEEKDWRIELLADAIDQNLIAWITEGKYICLYGGEDIDWIRNFTRSAKNVAREAGIQLELLYVGKRNPKEKVVRNIMNVIQAEKLSYTLEWSLIWFFWMRLESMWQSKGHQMQSEVRSGRVRTDNKKNDPVMQGIISMLSFGSSDRGWAVIGAGSSEMAKANGEHMHRSLSEYNLWNRRVNEIGFVPALIEYLTGVYKEAPHHCTSLILPATGLMPETVACAECGRLMERFTMFRCCTD